MSLMGEDLFRLPDGRTVTYEEYIQQLGQLPDMRMPNQMQPTQINPPPEPKMGQPVSGTIPAGKPQGLQINSGIKPQGVLQPDPSMAGFYGSSMKPPVDNTGSGNAGADAPEEKGFFGGLLDRMGGGGGLANRLGAAYFALHQDPNLQKFGMQGIQDIKESEMGNRTVEMLRKQGENTLADFIEKNPSMAKTALTQWLQSKYKTAAGIKTSEVKTDPKTGQLFVVETNPNTGEITRRDIGGAYGETPSQRRSGETQTALRESDLQAGRDMAQRYFTQAEGITSQISRLTEIESQLDAGASTGLINSILPAFDATTAQLRSAANQLGIDIINSATFGALSEKELELALKTAIDINLPPEQLKIQVKQKLDAQRKLRDELYRQAQRLSSGQIGASEFIRQQTSTALGTSSTLLDEADAIVGGN